MAPSDTTMQSSDCNEFQKLIDHPTRASQIHYRFLVVAFYSDLGRWKQFPTLQPNIEFIMIDYCVCKMDGWEARLERSQGNRYGIFGRGNMYPFFNHLKSLIKLFQRTLRKRQGSTYTQVSVKEFMWTSTSTWRDRYPEASWPVKPFACCAPIAITRP
jgi:hypothetical protein